MCCKSFVELLIYIFIRQFCLHSIQKLITGGYVDDKGAKLIYDALHSLIESSIEEIKVLQTVTLLLTTNNVVKGELLAKNLVLCFRLHFSKDSTTAHAAGATVRQLVALVFERIDKEESVNGTRCIRIVMPLAFSRNLMLEKTKHVLK